MLTRWRWPYLGGQRPGYKAHGRAKYDAIASGLVAARGLVEKDIVGTLKKELVAIRARLNVQSKLLASAFSN